MTYQLVMLGKDGGLIASDRREYCSPTSDEGQGHGAALNSVRKIFIEPKRKFAWAYAGGEIAPFASHYLAQEFGDVGRSLSPSDLERELKTCGDRAWDNVASGPNPNTTIVVLHGPSRKIVRAKLARGTIVEQMEGGQCHAGQTFSLATLFPRRFYSHEMTISELTALAAYTVSLAGELDPLLIGGLDIAVYRDVTGEFEFLGESACAELGRAFGERLDQSVREVIRELGA
jgi:hypothetical protein